MRILYDNKIMTATLSCCTENPNYPLTNLQETQLCLWYKSIAATSQWVKAYSASGIKASYLAIFAHNVADTATLKLEGNNADSWAAPSYSATVTHSGTGPIIFSFAEATYNYWRITIDDNSSVAVRLGFVYLGTYLQGPGMSIDQEISDNTDADIDFSLSGQAYGNDGVNHREFRVNFKHITDTIRDSMRTWFSTVKNITPFVMLLWANDFTHETPVYCVLSDKKITWKRTDNSLFPWETSINVREVF